MNCDRFSKLKSFFPFLDPLLYSSFDRFVKTKFSTFLRMAQKCIITLAVITVHGFLIGLRLQNGQKLSNY